MYLSIVIPYYNEKSIILESIENINNFFLNKFEFEIILIDDGNTNSFHTPDSYNKYNNLKIYKNPKNYGKGYSIRKGIKLSKGKIILVTDADLSTPINQFDLLHKEYKDGNDLVMGSRSTVDSKITQKQNFIRIFIGRMFNILVNRLAGLSFSDTQCGFKLFNGQKVKKIIAYSFINRFCIDVEILFLFNKSNFKIVEIGVEWHNDYNSSVRLMQDSFIMFVDLLKIKWKHRNFRPEDQSS